MRLIYVKLFCLLFCLTGNTLAAPSGSLSYLLFIWDNTLYAKPIPRGELQNLGEADKEVNQLLPDDLADVYDIKQSPLTTTSDLNYGFYHGIWSADRETFVYLELESNGLGYRVHRYYQGKNNLLFESEIGSRGYFDPIGWSTVGNLLFAERIPLHWADITQIWKWDEQAGTMTMFFSRAESSWSGRSILLPDGSGAFMGLDSKRQEGYLIDFETGALTTLYIPLVQPAPPKSVFGLYPEPIVTLGILSDAELNMFIRQLNAASTQNTEPARPVPFLHWMLQDSVRSITCYPDSNWTHANFDVTCPGLGIPSDYEGHQGTDIGGMPNGLAIGTEVYPALPGRVILTNDTCDESNPSCGSSYGNYMMMEHVVIIDGNAQTWFTGYAHLSEVLVNDYTTITDISKPIAHSGATGIGGAHLHFEVRQWMPYGVNLWVDPWGSYYPPHAQSLWIGGNELPTSSAEIKH